MKVEIGKIDHNKCLTNDNVIVKINDKEVEGLLDFNIGIAGSSKVASVTLTFIPTELELNLNGKMFEQGEKL